MDKRKIKVNKGNILNIPSVYKPRSKGQKISRMSLVTIAFLAGFFIWSLNLININFRPMIQNDPVVLRVFAPSIVQKGTSVEFTVECWDYSERLSCGYDGTVSLTAEREPSINASMVAAIAQFSTNSYTFIPSGINQGLIEAYRIPWGDQAHKTFIVTFTEPGIHYIKVLDEKLSTTPYYSNPIMVVDGVPENYLYWGDIHGHSAMCDGSGYIDQVLYYAKNIAQLDFASVTTHDQFINAMVAPYAWPLFWEQTKSLVENWNTKDDFVTIQAYEWRGNFIKPNDPQGDRNIYSRTSELPFFSGASKAYSNETELNAALKGWMSEDSERKVMTIHHHPSHDMMGMRTDWSSFDPEITRLVEIYSVHGSSEMSIAQGNPFPLMSGTKEPIELEVDKPGYHIRDALSMGYRLGFMASGDSHDGHIGHSLSHTEARHLWQPPLSWSAMPLQMFRTNHWMQNGIIGVFAPSLTREAIFDGMWNRATYGVKGTSRPYIDFSINGTSVGVNESILMASSVNATRNITLNVAAGGGDGNFLKKIEILKNNAVWKTIDLTGQQKRIYHGEIIDNSTMTGLSYWDYSGVDISAAPYYKDGKFYINEDANIGVNSLAEMSTNNETFYYVRVHTVGSVYYNNLYDTNYHNMPLVDRGDDVAWIGPIWVNPN